MAILALYFLACVPLVASDYACVCNYNVEEVVRAAPVPTGTTIGYMYEFDCREHIPMANLDSSWFAVAVEHRIGYIHSDSQIQVQICQGDPPTEDKVTTTTIPKSTTNTPSPTTITPKPTTTTTSRQTTTETTTEPTTTTPKQTTTTTPKRSTTTPRTTPKPSATTTALKTTTTTTTNTPKPTTTTTTPKPTTTTTTPKPATTAATPKPTTTTTTPKPATTAAITTPKPVPTTTTARPTTTTTTTTPKPTTTSTTTTIKPTTTTTTTTPRPTTTSTTTTPKSTMTLKPTTTTPIPTTVTPQPTVETPTTTTHKPVTYAPTATHKPVTHVPTIPPSNSPCYGTYHTHHSQIKGQLVRYGHTCYEFVTGASLWSSAEYDCRAKGGHLVRIANANEQGFIYNYLHKSHNNLPVWIGLRHAQLSGLHINLIHWISGGSVSYTHWSPSVAGHIQHNCVVLDPAEHGYWKYEDCETVDQNHHGYVCQYGGSSFTLPSTHAPTTRATTPIVHHGNPDGNTRLCTQFHQSHAQRHSNFLAQYGSSCYELVPNHRMTWQHAETMCEQGHGHLVHITSAEEQAFVQGFLQRHFRDHAVWIGLHDLKQEGKYEWSSGRWVTYTNFLPNHLNNYHSRYLENCFVIIPYKNGQWDDTDCGTSSGSVDYGNIYPPFCQFPIASASLIG